MCIKTWSVPLNGRKSWIESVPERAAENNVFTLDMIYSSSHALWILTARPWWSLFANALRTQFVDHFWHEIRWKFQEWD
jgi:hypothetical protein